MAATVRLSPFDLFASHNMKHILFFFAPTSRHSEYESARRQLNSALGRLVRRYSFLASKVVRHKAHGTEHRAFIHPSVIPEHFNQVKHGILRFHVIDELYGELRKVGFG